jgi:hypothetical protein
MRGRRVRCKGEMDSSPDVGGIIVSQRQSMSASTLSGPVVGGAAHLRKYGCRRTLREKAGHRVLMLPPQHCGPLGY